MSETIIMEGEWKAMKGNRRVTTLPAHQICDCPIING